YGPSIQVMFRYDRATWPDQVNRVCELIESEWRGNPLDSAIVFQGSEAAHRPVIDRKRFLQSRAKTRLCRFTLTNHSSCVMASGAIGSRYVGQIVVGGTVDPDGRYKLSVSLPPSQAEATYRSIELALHTMLGADVQS
ncbi:MAG: hypothetical protein OSA97_20925, partial [Nevskia sp.]|nr:hypothetical protein [Nevskia sp.]